MAVVVVIDQNVVDSNIQPNDLPNQEEDPKPPSPDPDPDLEDPDKGPHQKSESPPLLRFRLK